MPVFLFLCFCCLVGAFGDEVKSVSVMKGHNVTLNTNLTHIQTDDVINWSFGLQKTLIATVNRAINKTTIKDIFDGRFRDRLQVDHQTGSLTITNIRTTDSGLYQMIIINNRKTSYTFNVTVYGLNFNDKVMICCAAVGSLMIVTAVLIFCVWRKHTNTQQQDQIIYADATFSERQTHQPRSAVENEVVYAGVAKRR